MLASCEDIRFLFRLLYELDKNKVNNLTLCRKRFSCLFHPHRPLSSKAMNK